MRINTQRFGNTCITICVCGGCNRPYDMHVRIYSYVLVETQSLSPLQASSSPLQASSSPLLPLQHLPSLRQLLPSLRQRCFVHY
jgi:hypothetical protein